MLPVLSGPVSPCNMLASWPPRRRRLVVLGGAAVAITALITAALLIALLPKHRQHGTASSGDGPAAIKVASVPMDDPTYPYTSGAGAVLAIP